MYGMMSIMLKYSSLFVPYTTEKTTIETIDSWGCYRYYCIGSSTITMRRYIDVSFHLYLLLAGCLVYFEISIRVFSAVDTRLLFPHGEFVDVLHTFSGEMADIAEQAEIVWCLNSSETKFVAFFQLKMTVMMMANTLRDFSMLAYGCL